MEGCSHQPVSVLQQESSVLASGCFEARTVYYLLDRVFFSDCPTHSWGLCMQAVMGTLVKRFLAKQLGLDPAQIYHCAVMPCYDKKLEGSRDDFMVPGMLEPYSFGQHFSLANLLPHNCACFMRQCCNCLFCTLTSGYWLDVSCDVPMIASAGYMYTCVLFYIWYAAHNVAFVIKQCQHSHSTPHSSHSEW